MKKIYITLVLTITVAIAQAQTPVTAQTIRWEAGSIDNLTTGQTEPEGDHITIDGTNQIDWQDAEGTVKYRFSIQSTTGTWTDLNIPGSVQYNFTFESQPGQFTVTREGVAITIHVKLYMEETPAQEYEMTITNYTVQ